MITRQALFHGPSTLSARPSIMQANLSVSSLAGLGSFGEDDGSSVLDDIWAAATGGKADQGSTQTWSGESNGFETAGYVSQEGTPLTDCTKYCEANNLPRSASGLSCNKGYAPTQVECGCWSCRPSTSSTSKPASVSSGTGTAGAPKTPPRVDEPSPSVASVLMNPMVLAGGLVAIGLGYLVYKKKAGKSSSYAYSSHGY